MIVGGQTEVRAQLSSTIMRRLTRAYNGKIVVEGFWKKVNEAEEIASLDMGASILFHQFSRRIYRKYILFFIANERDFYTVVLGLRESKSVPKVTYYFSSIVE